MKHSKLLLVALLVFAMSSLFACTEVTKHEHEYSAWEMTTAPTLVNSGSAQRQCTKCGEVDKDYVPALNDSTVWTLTEKKPTHLELGSNTYTSKYGVIVYEVEKLKDHEYGDWSITVIPTKETVGSAVKTCPCGLDAITEEVPELTDTEVWSVEITDATHFDEGSEVYTSVYGEVTVVIPVIEHVYGAWSITTAPTKTEEGKAVRTCDCTHVDEAVVPVLTDASVWTVAVTPADHFNEGSEVYTSVYGEVTVVIPVIEHVYGAWSIATAPTKTEEGKAVRTCDCTHEDEVVLPVLTDASVWAVAVTPADHFNEGAEVYTSVYGEVTVVLEKDPTHVYGDWIIAIEPTYDTKGSATRHCDCDYDEVVDLPVLTDDSVWTLAGKVDPDYNNKGENTYSSIYGDVVIATAKLVAPYDGKTYSNVHYDAEIDDNYYKNGVVTPDDVWKNATVTINEESKGEGSAYPFMGLVEITMVNAATGEISIKVTGYTTNEDGDRVLNPESVSVKAGFVDFATGLMVIPHGSSAIYNTMLVLTPYGMGVNDDTAVATSVASAWDNSIAIDYNVIDGDNHSIFVHKERVYFGVSFVDMDGNAIVANACYNAPYVKVLDKDGNVIEAFAHNGEKLVISDKYEGTYAGELGDIVVSGYGVATVDGADATYVIIEDGVLGVYANGEYVECTLADGAYTFVKPMVEITFDAGEFATVEAVSLNKNIAYVLPTPSHETHSFKGWYYDADFANAVEVEFVPTASVTLYALWTEKVVVYLDGVLDGDATVIYLGEGDVIGDYLPEYGLELELGVKFVGWVIIIDGEETDLPLEAVLTPEDSGVTVYAKWEEIPAYYGTYYGGEIWNASYGNSGGKTLTIDENGNISGFREGRITSYDPATQVVTWTTNGTNAYKFYFNEELDIIAGIYSSYDISNDFYFFSKHTEATNGKVNAHYGVKAAKNPGDSTRGWYAHLINVETKLGTREVFLYNNYIYTNFTAVDGQGNPLTAATVKDSKILVVKDADGNIIVSVASEGSSFLAQSNTIDLDSYFGTYVNGEDTLIFDGTGVATLNGVEGTYELAVDGSSYQFDVYLADNTEYYEVTLDGSSFIFNKPMVTVTFEEGEYASVEDVTVNKNIVLELPFLTHDTNVFNGWFYDAEFTSPVGTSITPTSDVTVHALWKVKKLLTIVYNNGDDTAVVEYSEGDVANIEMPIYKKHAFVGWYTTEDFADGSEWTNGSEITTDVTVYAKWEDAPAFYNDYTVTRITDTNLTGEGYMYFYSSYSTGAYIFKIDAYGNGNGTGSPFSGSFSVENYDETTGYLEIHKGSDVYFGYMDNETGIIVTEYVKDKGLDQVFFFNPFTTETVSSTNLSRSYWNYGKSRAIQYTYGGTTYSIFVHNDMVYYGVSFVNANGEAVSAKACKESETLFVNDKDGNLIAKFAYDGSSLQLMDGYEGTYAGENEVVIDGVKTITIDGVKGEYAHVEGATFTVEAYVDGCYYEVTLDKDAYIAVVNKPMVTITYDAGELATVESSVVNKNIAFAIPTVSCDTHVFRGWFFDAEYAEAVPADFIPTEDDTFYAMWAEKVTVTVVYGNGLENVVLEYAVGDAISLSVPGATNGLYFEGWYEDAEFTTPFTATTVSGTATVYCNWTDVAPFTVEQYSSAYAMVYDASTGAWTNTNQGAGSTNSGLTITATVIDIEVTFNWSVSSESNWDGLVVYANGKQEISEKSGGSGEKSGSFTFTVRAGNNVQIYYKKDGSGDKGDDTLTITGLTVAGVTVTEVA